MISRLGHIVMWFLVLVLVLLATFVTALRITLPHINRYQGEIAHWMSYQTGVDVSIGNVEGFWRNTHPSISLKNLKANLPDASNIRFNIDKLDVEFDLIQSLLQRQLVVAKLDIHNSNLDISKVDLLALKNAQSESQLNDSQNEQQTVLRHLDNIFLRQLGDFTLVDSKIKYTSFEGVPRELLIDHLKWLNDGRKHRAEGIISVANTGFNSLGVKARFEDYDSFKDITGQFYVSAKAVSVGPWFTKYLKDKIGINSGTLSFNAWFSLIHNKASDGYVQIRPSVIGLSGSVKNTVRVNSGVLKLSPLEKGGVELIGQKIHIETNAESWPELNFASTLHDGQVALNINQLKLHPLLPVVLSVLGKSDAGKTLAKLNPEGDVDDLRLTYSKQAGLAYSAQLSHGGITQWSLLPGLKSLNAEIMGNDQKAEIKAQIENQTLPYGDVFQAPLNIHQGQAELVWQRDTHGWSLWSDHLSVSTPDMDALGEFKLDFPDGKSPFLSFYAEANVEHAGETWRYLPTRALGPELTNYLSAAIQGGQSRNAKLLWYGPVSSFPYSHHDGIFQVAFRVTDGRFSFDTAWPPLEKMNINLLFNNDAMSFKADSVESMNVKSHHIVGEVAHLDSTGVLNIKASLNGDGADVRNYMMATPLVDSVGAALTTLKVSGNVNSNLQLAIPFDGSKLPHAMGWSDLSNNTVVMPTLNMTLNSVNGRIYFNDDVIKADGISGNLLDQHVSLGFNGESQQKDYHIHINALGNWKVKPLTAYVDPALLAPISGNAPWKLGVDVQLNDVGFTYQADLNANLKMIGSRYPAPLNKVIGTEQQAVLQASGNQETVSARLQLPNVKYQTEIDISGADPRLTATNLVVGTGSFKVSPIVGNDVTIRQKAFNFDDWMNFLRTVMATNSSAKGMTNKKTASSLPEIPLPEHITLDTKELTLGSLKWHDVKFEAKHKPTGWFAEVSSQEAQGQGTYSDTNDLSLSLSKLHVYVPALEKTHENGQTVLASVRKSVVKVTPFERAFHRLMPNLTLSINDFWLQGYRVGTVYMDMQRQDNALVWKNIDIVSGKNKIQGSGTWMLNGDDSHTKLNLRIQGDNNTEIMERFGISSGIQKASFDIGSQIEWRGSPWSMQVNTLAGHINIKFGKGFVSDVSGAAKLIGLFSLDSIIRKMQLDFSDVFDKGMAFDSIEGSGDISQGVFVTNNIKMDAVPGDMSIKGLVNLNSRMVDAEVSFVPDITSGIPVLSAFAVTPQTALYVLAITTVISPVVEVFTQVNYEVKGPIDSPTVKEISRSKGEFKLPKDFKKQVEKQKTATSE